MFTSLFLFDLTFWLYLAAVALYIGYVALGRTRLQLAAAGPGQLSTSDWSAPVGQLATMVTAIGLFMNTLALGARAYERYELTGTFAPWSNQFEAMAFVAWAIIVGYLLLEFKYAPLPFCT